MAVAAPSRVGKGSINPPAMAVEQLMVRLARRMGRALPGQLVGARCGQVAVIQFLAHHALDATQRTEGDAMIPLEAMALPCKRRIWRKWRI